MNISTNIMRLQLKPTLKLIPQVFNHTQCRHIFIVIQNLLLYKGIHSY